MGLNVSGSLGSVTTNTCLSSKQYSPYFYSSVTDGSLTHWGRVTHICVGKPTSIGSDNGLSTDRRQTIIWTNAGILFTAPLETNFSEILTGTQRFSIKKIHFKMSSPKWRPFCLGLNMLMEHLDHPTRFKEDYIVMLMKFSDLSESVRSNWVMWQVKDPCPRPGWDGCLTRKNCFHKKYKNLDNIAVYLIACLKSKWKKNTNKNIYIWIW